MGGPTSAPKCAHQEACMNPGMLQPTPSRQKLLKGHEASTPVQKAACVPTGTVAISTALEVVPRLLEHAGHDHEHTHLDDPPRAYPNVTSGFSLHLNTTAEIAMSRTVADGTLSVWTKRRRL